MGRSFVSSILTRLETLSGVQLKHAPTNNGLAGSISSRLVRNGYDLKLAPKFRLWFFDKISEIKIIIDHSDLREVEKMGYKKFLPVPV